MHIHRFLGWTHISTDWIHRRLGGVRSPLGRPPHNRGIASCLACVCASLHPHATARCERHGVNGTVCKDCPPLPQVRAEEVTHGIDPLVGRLLRQHGWHPGIVLATFHPGLHKGEGCRKKMTKNSFSYRPKMSKMTKIRSSL